MPIMPIWAIIFTTISVIVIMIIGFAFSNTVTYARKPTGFPEDLASSREKEEIMIIKQFNKKISKINGFIEEAEVFKDNLIKELRQKIENIESKADERESGENTEREEEKIEAIQNQIDSLEEVTLEELDEAKE